MEKRTCFHVLFVLLLIRYWNAFYFFVGTKVGIFFDITANKQAIFSQKRLIDPSKYIFRLISISSIRF